MNSVHENEELLKLKNTPNKYPYLNFDKTRDIKVVYIYNLDDVIKHIKLNKGTPLKFITENSLRRMLFEMIEKNTFQMLIMKTKKLILCISKLIK